MTEPVEQGRCFCGAIRIEARGAALFSGYCHCQDCRDWSGSPMASFIMWPHAAVTVLQGQEDLMIAGRIPETPRGWCGRCGGHIGAFRTERDQPHVAASPHIFPALAFAPTMHVFCGEAVIAVDDELPRYRELPEAFGGSGALMPNP